MLISLSKLSLCLVGSMTSPIWGSLYINCILGKIANRHSLDESGGIYRINKAGQYKHVKIETEFEKKVSGCGSAQWFLLYGGVPYIFEPFMATFYLPTHLIKKGFDRND